MALDGLVAMLVNYAKGVWPFKRKPEPTPWWVGYTEWPSPNTDEVSICLTDGVNIVRINNRLKQVTIEHNYGTFLNTKLVVITIP